MCVCKSQANSPGAASCVILPFCHPTDDHRLSLAAWAIRLSSYLDNHWEPSESFLITHPFRCKIQNWTHSGSITAITCRCYGLFSRRCFVYSHDCNATDGSTWTMLDITHTASNHQVHPDDKARLATALIITVPYKHCRITNSHHWTTETVSKVWTRIATKIATPFVTLSILSSATSKYDFHPDYPKYHVTTINICIKCCNFASWHRKLHHPSMSPLLEWYFPMVFSTCSKLQTLKRNILVSFKRPVWSYA